MPTSITITGTPAAIAGGTFQPSIPVINGSIAPQFSLSNLASGNNSFTVPAGSIGVMIFPPATNAIVLRLKTTSGDTGLNMPQALPSIFFFDPANLPATLYVNAASNTTGNTQVVFI